CAAGTGQRCRPHPDQSRPPDRDGVPGHGSCRGQPRHDRRRPDHRHQLPRFRAADAGSRRRFGPMIIAIDGPAAAGKGTLARRLAEHFKLAFLDTGSLYRAVAAKVLGDGHVASDLAAAATAARSLTPDDTKAPNLRTEAVGEAASVVAAQPAVRAALLEFQR